MPVHGPRHAVPCAGTEPLDSTPLLCEGMAGRPARTVTLRAPSAAPQHPTTPRPWAAHLPPAVRPPVGLLPGAQSHVQREGHPHPHWPGVPTGLGSPPPGPLSLLCVPRRPGCRNRTDAAAPPHLAARTAPTAGGAPPPSPDAQNRGCAELGGTEPGGAEPGVHRGGRASALKCAPLSPALPSARPHPPRFLFVPNPRCCPPAPCLSNFLAADSKPGRTKAPDKGHRHASFQGALRRPPHAPGTGRRPRCPQCAAARGSWGHGQGSRWRPAGHPLPFGPLMLSLP